MLLISDYTNFRLCRTLSSSSAEICQLSGRNSRYTYPQSIPGVEDPIEIGILEILLFAIEALNPQPPQECIDAALHSFCLLVNPPCDPISDLRLPICERSCQAITKLRSEEVCTELDTFVSGLAQSSMENRFQSLRELYFSFDCRNESTYDSYNGALNFTQDGRCTSVISPEAEGQA